MYGEPFGGPYFQYLVNYLLIKDKNIIGAMHGPVIHRQLDGEYIGMAGLNVKVFGSTVCLLYPGPGFRQELLGNYLVGTDRSRPATNPTRESSDSRVAIRDYGRQS